jgi:molecular chaperone HscB
MINKALKTFKNDDETIKYVLQLKQLLEEEEKYQLPPEFLAEMMELNEDLMEVDDSSLEETETKISQLEKHLYDKVQNIVEYYNEDNTTNEQLLLVKDYYFKKKYLKRILERLDGMRNIASQN